MRKTHLTLVTLFLVAAMLVTACGASTAPAADQPAQPAPAEQAPAEPAPAEPAPQEQATGKSTLETIKERGKLVCGVNQAVPGFGFLTPDGEFEGFDVDACKAVAAAVLGDAKAVEYRASDSPGPFPGAGQRRDRSAQPQHHHDHEPRHVAGLRLHRHHFL